jgi:hypothetical protein
MACMVPKPAAPDHDLAGHCEPGPTRRTLRRIRHPTTDRSLAMRALLTVITAAFTAITVAIMLRTGLIGFYQQLLASPAAWQTLMDVTVALGLVLAWMWQDARRHGRAFWPWVPVTLLLGSLGPLLYLIRRPPQPSER